MSRVVTVEMAVDLLQEMYAVGVRSVDPVVSLTNAIRPEGSRLVTPDGSIELGRGRVIAIAIGKAAFGMAEGLWQQLGERIDRGYILTKEGVAGQAPSDRFAVAFASHPVPDGRGVAATREILALVDDLSPEDVVIALVSGGGSALLESPKPPLTLDDIQRTTDLLLRAGAPIQDLNAVRSELSLVKGGGLRRRIGLGRCVTVILSDVLGNDPTVIASGPTVPRTPNPDQALALIRRYGLIDQMPTAVMSTLGEASSRQHARSVPVDAIPKDDLWVIVGDNAHFIAALAEEAGRQSYTSKAIWKDHEGEAADMAVAFVDACASADENVDVVLGGGEATVTVRGRGIGGRNTEFALAAALELERRNLPWVIASLASDGDDGNNDGAAGGFVDRGLMDRARAAGLDPVAALQDNDSGTLLAASGGLFRTRPTGTNVNDAYIGIRLDSGEPDSVVTQTQG